MKGSQNKKSSSTFASLRRITDFFATPKPNAPAVANNNNCNSSGLSEAATPSTQTGTTLCDVPLAATACDTESVDVAAPLFDPLDDKDDELGHLDISEDLSQLDALKHAVLTEQKSGPMSSVVVAVPPPCKPESTVSALSSRSSNCTSPSKKHIKHPLVFEDDEDDMDLLLNMSYDFVTKEFSKAPVAADDTAEKSITVKPKRAARSEIESIISTSRRSAPAKDAYSIQSLLKDKANRERQLQEASIIETMLEASLNAEKTSAIDPLKYLEEFIDSADPSSLNSEASNLKKKRKARLDEEDCDDDEETVDKRSNTESKKRIKSALTDMMNVKSVEHLVVFDSVKLHRPNIVFNFIPSSDDKLGEIVLQALSDPDKYTSFLLSGALNRAVETSQWEFPDSLCNWLFQTACYSSSDILASAAAKTLNNNLEHSTLTCNGTNTAPWIITPSVFNQILQSYGFYTKLFIFDNDGPTVDSFIQPISTHTLSATQESDSFADFVLPAFNLCLCVELYISCLTNRGQFYPPHTIETTFELLVRMSLDARVSFATGPLLANAVAKLARLLVSPEDESVVHASFDRLFRNFVAFVAVPSPLSENHNNPIWQDALVCSSYSALVGAASAAASSCGGCPKRRGVVFLERLRRYVAAVCVIRAGLSGGFRKSDAVANGDEHVPDENVDTRDITSLQNLNRLISKYSVSPSCTDYIRLGARIRVLSVAVGGVSGIKEQPTEARELKASLDRIRGSINDTQFLAMDRVLAKESIHDLSTFIALCLPNSLQKQTSVFDMFKK